MSDSTTAIIPETEKSKDTNSIICTHAFLDDHLYEQVYDATRRLSWFVFRDEKGLFNSRVAVPLPKQRTLLKPLESELIHKRRVIFPQRPECYGSTTELANEIGAHMDRYVALPEDMRPFVPYFILCSWIYDRFETVPYLRLIGDLGVGKSRALKVIGHLCYHPFIAGGSATMSPIFRGLDMLGGATLVVDECDFHGRDADDHDMMTLLRQGFQKGQGVLRSEPVGDSYEPRDFDVFGPKVLAGRRNFPDPALESRCIRLYMQSGMRHEHLPVELPPEYIGEVIALQNKLLMWRFDHYTSELRTPRRLEIESRLLQLYGPLASVVEDAAALIPLEAAILALQAELTESRLDSDEGRVLAMLVEIARELVETGLPHRILVKAVADRVSTKWRALSSKRVKTICLGFGLKDGGKTSEGVTVLFDPKEHVEVLRRYGLEFVAPLAAAA